MPAGDAAFLGQVYLVTFGAVGWGGDGVAVPGPAHVNILEHADILAGLTRGASSGPCRVGGWARGPAPDWLGGSVAVRAQAGLRFRSTGCPRTPRGHRQVMGRRSHDGVRFLLDGQPAFAVPVLGGQPSAGLLGPGCLCRGRAANLVLAGMSSRPRLVPGRLRHVTLTT